MKDLYIYVREINKKSFDKLQEDLLKHCAWVHSGHEKIDCKDMFNYLMIREKEYDCCEYLY